MALGTVSVNNLNLGQGPVTEIERYFLFIGPMPKNIGKLDPLNTQSDLDVQLGNPDSDLKQQIAAARASGSSRWAAMAAPIAPDGSWQDALALRPARRRIPSRPGDYPPGGLDGYAARAGRDNYL